MPEVPKTTNDRIISTVENYQPRLSRWYRNGLSGKKIVFIGDSTTLNATTLFSRLDSYHNVQGEALYGIADADFVNQGNNGASLAAYLAGSGTYHLSHLYAADPDLVVVCYGINDVRLNTSTTDQLAANLETLIGLIRRHLPDADILLAIPNSLLTTDVGSLGYVSGITAQDATDRMWTAYKRMENRWPNVVVFDKQSLIYGRTCFALSDYMTDQLHPSGNGQKEYARQLAEFLGVRDPYNDGAAYVARTLADAAVAASISGGTVPPVLWTPWSSYPRVVEDPDYFDLVAYGEYVGQGNNYVDFGWAAARVTEIFPGDLVQMGNHNTPFVLPTSTALTTNGANTRLSNLGSLVTSSSPTMGAGVVSVYRPKYGDATIETYLKQKVVYPYRRRGWIVSGGSGFIDVGGYIDNDRFAKFWHPSTSDYLLVVGQSALQLSGATFSANGNNLRILKSGTYTNYATANPLCAIVGAHLYESGSALEVAS